MSISIHSPHQLIGAVPALLGFQPEESIVILGLRDKGVLWVLRTDVDLSPDDVIDQTAPVITREDEMRVVISVFTHRPFDQMRLYTDELVEKYRLLDVHVMDVLLVGECRWWSLLCTFDQCCPQEGYALPTETSEVEAERVLLGLPAVANSREDYLADYVVTPDRFPAQTDLEGAVNRMDGDPIEVADAVMAHLHALPTLSMSSRAHTHATCAVMIAVQNLAVRDLVIGHMVDLEEPQEALDTLIRITFETPDDLRGHVAGCAAAVASAHGVPSAVVWRLIDSAGDNSLAIMVGQALTMMIEPAKLRDTFRGALPIIYERLGV